MVTHQPHIFCQQPHLKNVRSNPSINLSKYTTSIQYPTKITPLPPNLPNPNLKNGPTNLPTGPKHRPLQAHRKRQVRTPAIPRQRKPESQDTAEYAPSTPLPFLIPQNTTRSPKTSLERVKLTCFTAVHSLTDVCWKKCVTGTIKSGKLEKSEETCAANCVDRFMDANMTVIQHLNKMRGGS